MQCVRKIEEFIQIYQDYESHTNEQNQSGEAYKNSIKS